MTSEEMLRLVKLLTNGIDLVQSTALNMLPFIGDSVFQTLVQKHHIVDKIQALRVARKQVETANECLRQAQGDVADTVAIVEKQLAASVVVATVPSTNEHASYSEAKEALDHY